MTSDLTVARPDVTAYGPMTPPVHVRNLHVTLGGARILQGVDLVVRDGETVALMGANGSGKSTLVKALLSVVPVTSGTVEVFGVDVATAHRRVPWRRVGYVPQRVGAASGTPATALEVVASGLLDNGRLRPPRGWHDLALTALDEVGLADRAGETVSVFSGGQQPRPAGARVGRACPPPSTSSARSPACSSAPSSCATDGSSTAAFPHRPHPATAAPSTSTSTPTTRTTCPTRTAPSCAWSCHE